MSLTGMISICACVSVYAAGTAMMLPFRVMNDMRRNRRADQQDHETASHVTEAEHQDPALEVTAGEPIPFASETSEAPMTDEWPPRQQASDLTAGHAEPERVDTAYDVIDSADVQTAMSAADDECSTADETSSEISLSQSGQKHWFLVKSKTGAVRVCEAWEPTPKTIAGPFLTKEAALLAKEAD